jgi:hypothetical protein
LLAGGLLADDDGLLAAVRARDVVLAGSAAARFSALIFSACAMMRANSAPASPD